MEEALIEQLEQESNDLRSKNAQLQTAISSSAYQTQEEPNLIHFQLDSAELLEKLEQFLKGSYIVTDKNGNQYYEKQKNQDLILFNEYGVNSIMLIIGNYIDKNTTLSRYDEMRINEILADLGDKLSEFIFCNYEKMGMDTEFKKSRYPITVLNILHSIESAYRRALGGKTFEDINTSRIVTQSDPLGYRNASPSPKKGFNLFNYKTW